MRSSLLLVALSATAALATTSQWSCSTLAQQTLAPGASWTRYNCTATNVPYLPLLPATSLGPIVVNVVEAQLAAPGLRLVPITAANNGGLATVDAIAAKSAYGANVLAGINGGYFWEINKGAKWFDNVCMCKTYDEATKPASFGAPNQGISDGYVVANGTLLGSDCDCFCCFNKPSFITINGTQTRIDLLDKGAKPPAGLLLDSLSAGPHLLATNDQGVTDIAIPWNDENIANVLEHASNTAVALRASTQSALFVTVDGADGCSQPTCGVNSYQLAYLLKDFLHATSGMNMDQGGSTTMYVNGHGVVTNPSAGVRAVGNGLFLVRD